MEEAITELERQMNESMAQRRKLRMLRKLDTFLKWTLIIGIPCFVILSIVALIMGAE
jgi:O-antigen/teichoic acid export membrane protein